MIVRPRIVTLVLVAATLSLAACGEDTETVSSPWNLTQLASGEQLRLSVRVGSSSCNEFKRVETTEDDTSVTLEALVDVSTDGDCTADDSYEEVTVDLDRDLGDRALSGCRPDDGPLLVGVDGPALDEFDDCRMTVAP